MRNLTPPHSPKTPEVVRRPVSAALTPSVSLWIPAGVKLSEIPNIPASRVTYDEMMSPQCKRLHREPSSPHRSMCGMPVRVNETDVALFRSDDRIFATELRCPHMGANLTQGGRLLVDDIEDFAIECPLHKLRFDLRSGKLLCKGVAESLKIHPVRVKGDGTIEVGFEELILEVDGF